MAQISASDVSKLRKTTGAGMMDCKNALLDADGDFDKAIEIIRKKGQAVANKRAGREATEGVVLAQTNSDNTFGALIVLNCETDFVAKNENFISFANSILELAINNKPEDLKGLLSLSLNEKIVADVITEQVGIIGEKLELSAYEKVIAEEVVTYIHPGNKLATIVGFNKTVPDNQVAKDIAMQVAAMNPVAVDKNDVSEDIIEKDLIFPAYDMVLKCSHIFNLLEARGAISVAERTGYISRIRNLARKCARNYIEKREEMGYPLMKRSDSSVS